MESSSISFGTDGWRGVIADTYTFQNLGRVAAATGAWLRETDAPVATRAVVGYDTRFLSPEFARHVAKVLASCDVPTILSTDVTPTPAVSAAAKRWDCGVGIAITASHNPPEYNGFKLKTAFGGPLPPEQVAEVEGYLDRVEPPSTLRSVESLGEDGLLEERDLTSPYLDEVRARIDLDAIRGSGIRVAYDAMFGAGQNLLAGLLNPAQVVELHHDRNPGFHGQAPEPIARNLEKLSQTVVEEDCDVGLATDGDADRIGMYDEHGNFVDPHRILSLLLWYLHDRQGMSGKVVKTFSTTDLLDKMTDAYGLELDTTPVGFKYIGRKIVEDAVLVGGEESGGIAVRGHLPERDGLFIGLLVTEMVVKEDRPLSSLIQELFDQYGPHHYYRRDEHTTEVAKQTFLAWLGEDGLGEVDGDRIETVETLDGYKYRTQNGWVMIRPSGTEPVLRIYSEAERPETARRYVRYVVDLLHEKAL